MQCYKQNAQCLNNSYTQQTTCHPKLPQKLMDNQNKDQKLQTTKHLKSKNKLIFKFGLKEGNLNLENLLLLPHLQKHERGAYHFEI